MIAIGNGVTIVVTLAAAIASAAGGFALGMLEQQQRERDRKELVAAAVCPACRGATEPAERLIAADARVSAVEFYIDYPRKHDPVSDANAIIRAAMRRARQLEDARVSPQSPVARQDRRP